jgi:hypothetical protein
MWSVVLIGHDIMVEKVTSEFSDITHSSTKGICETINEGSSAELLTEEKGANNANCHARYY